MAKSKRKRVPKTEVNQIRFSSCSATFQFRRRSDTSGASSVFTMRLMITSAWSRMRRREGIRRPTSLERSGCAENAVCEPVHRTFEAWSYSHASTPDSQLGSMCECGRRTGDRIGLISKVHGCDETAVHGEYITAFSL
jgi:hypothetical protein